jgi:hypothetical protein
MAEQQAWDDFCTLKAQMEYFEGQISTCIKGELSKLQSEVAAILADPARTAACVALADQHPKWTAAAMLAYNDKLMALKAYLSAQGF